MSFDDIQPGHDFAWQMYDQVISLWDCIWCGNLNTTLTLINGLSKKLFETCFCKKIFM